MEAFLEIHFLQLHPRFSGANYVPGIARGAKLCGDDGDVRHGILLESLYEQRFRARSTEKQEYYWEGPGTD